MASIVPEVDFTSLGNLGQIYQQSRDRAQTQEYLQQQGLPANLSLAQLALANRRDDRDFGFRQQEANRAQGNVDRSFALQAQQAAEAARGYDYREIDDGQGGKRLVRINKATSEVSAPKIEGVSDTPANPFAQGRMNDEQSKAALYSSRMFNAEKILGDPSVVEAATSLKQQGMARVPIAGNFLVSDNFQKFDQAQRDFINAVLRRESGAAIAATEFANATQQYFPQPGDSAEKLAQKRANRIEAIRGIAAAAGPGYRPDNTFDEKGNVVPNPAPKRNQPQAQPQPQAASWKNKETITAARANPQATVAEAMKAIQGGADANAVRQRLQAIGLDLPQGNSSAGAIY